MVRFERVADDGASEVLTIVRLDEGEIYSEALDRETPYAVEVCAGPSVGDDFVGVYDLDGERIDGLRPRSWAIADDVPAEVVEAVEDGWSTGLNVVSRLASEVARG